MRASVAPSTSFSQLAVPRTSFEHLLIGALPKTTNPPQRPLAVSGFESEPSKTEE